MDISDGSHFTQNNTDADKIHSPSVALQHKLDSKIVGGDCAPNFHLKLKTSTPYALHNEKSSESKNGMLMVSPQSPRNAMASSPSNALPNLRAPYAQPVLDASKLHSNKQRTTVDERIAFVRERRLQQQQIQDEAAQNRLSKAKEVQAHWEQSQEERKRKIEETRTKEELRRKQVEERKNKYLVEEKKRAEAIVARTDQQVEVVLRQKRSASTDRTKRWSWGAGYGGGGSTGANFSTYLDPAPFHYFDPNRLTKRISSTDVSKSPSNTSSSISLKCGTGEGGSSETNIGTDSSHGSPALGSPAGNRSVASESKFSVSPLLLSTQHMAFASALRSYDSTPPSSADKTQLRSRRGRSVDTKSKTRTSSKDSRSSASNTKTTKSTESNAVPPARGRSPNIRQSSTSKKGNTSSPHVTEPGHVSARLLAPTKASIARSSKHEAEEISITLNSSGPLRSRSSDRKLTKGRPSSVRSDTSSTSSSYSSPRGSNDVKSKHSPAPSLSSTSHKGRSSHRPPSPVLKSARPPSPVSRNATESKDTPKRRPSPARKSYPAPVLKKTHIRESQQQSKSTPPTIKQTLKPNLGSAKLKSTLSPSPALKSASRSTKTASKEKLVRKNLPNGKTEGQNAVLDKKPDSTSVPKTGSKKANVSSDDIAATNIDALDVSSSSGLILSSDNVLDVTITLQSQENEDIPHIMEIEAKHRDKSVNENFTVEHINAEPSMEGKPIVEVIYEAEPITVNEEKKVNSSNANTIQVSSIEVVKENGGESIIDIKPHLPNEVQKGDKTDISVEEELNNVAMKPSASSTVEVETVALSTNEEKVHNDLIKDHQKVTPIIEHMEKNKLEENDQKLSGELDDNLNQSAAIKAAELSDKIISEAQEELEREEMEERNNDDMPPEPASLKYLSENREVIEMNTTETACNADNDKSHDTPKSDETCTVVVEEDKEESYVQNQVAADKPILSESPVMKPDFVGDQPTSNESQIAKSRSADEETTNDDSKVIKAKSEDDEPTLSEPQIKLSKSTNDKVTNDESQMKISRSADKEPISSESPMTKFDDDNSISEDKSTSNQSQIIISSSITNKSSNGESSIKSDNSEVESKVSIESNVVAAQLESSTENKKKEKKLSPEEQAYKETIAAKRREMREKREREERERLERKRLEAEEQLRREEAARQMAEEARLEQERMMEEERIKQEEAEKKKKEAEEIARKHEEFIREQREKMEQKAREEAEKIRKDREIAAQKKDEERLARKKRLDMIMRRTRGGGDSPNRNPSPSGQIASGDQSPANATSSGACSPYNSVTPDRVGSPVNIQVTRNDSPSGQENVAPINESRLPTELNVTLPCNNDSTVRSLLVDAESIPMNENNNTDFQPNPFGQPFVAFAANMNGSYNANNTRVENTFIPINQDEHDSAVHNDIFSDSLSAKAMKAQEDSTNDDTSNHSYNTIEKTMKTEVATGNLLDL